MSKITFIFIFLNCFSLFAKGAAELPHNYIHLGKIEISNNKKYELLLPYNKPEGIDEIYTLGLIGISVIQIIGDGRTIRPRGIGGFMGGSDNSTLRFREAYVAEIDKGSMDLYFRMIWNRIVDGNTEVLYYRSINGGKTFQYILPNNTREIYITYRIRFPDRSEIEDTEEQTVFFIIDWI